MQKIDITWFEQVYELMEEAFPKEERRCKGDQKALYSLSNYHVYGIIEGNKLQAILTSWDLEGMQFVEHLATRATLRGSGLGKQLLLEFMETTKKIILLEVEHPTTDIAKRRIAFYERLGFHLYHDIDYAQPSFYKDGCALPLHLMTAPKRLSSEEIRICIKVLYQDVYGIDTCF